MSPSIAAAFLRQASGGLRALLLLVFVLVSSGSVTGCSNPQGDDAAPPEDAPQGTDIYLFRLSPTGVEQGPRVTNRDGYDNQPMFSADGSRLLFTSDRDFQMDSYAYDLATGTVTRLTETRDGEYSPTPVPGAPGAFSVIRMDTLGVQELWRYSMTDTTSTRIALIDRVGYHTWVDSTFVLFFRLGQPSTLQLVRSGTADTTIIDRAVGRSLHHIPGQRASSYLKKVSPDHWEIMRYEWDTGAVEALAVALPGVEDYAWTPDGTLLMAAEGVLYSHAPMRDVDWIQVAELGLTGTSRIAVSPDGGMLAVVAARQTGR